MKPIRLLIGIPSNRNPSWKFIHALESLKNHTRWHGLGDGFRLERFETHIETGCSLLPQGRQNILDLARKDNFTHLLFLDDDMTFPPDMLVRLFAHKQPAVGVNAPQRSHDLRYTAVDMSGDIMQSFGKKDLVQAGGCGLSVFLLDLNYIVDILSPHFEVTWQRKNGRYHGEDEFFCWKLNEKGVPIHIDQHLSNEIGHIGEFVYSYASCSPAHSANRK